MSWASFIGVLLMAVVGTGCASNPSGRDEFANLESDGQQMITDGRWPEAEAVYTELINRYPADADDARAAAYFYRSVSFFEMGRIEEAAADETAGINLNPSDVELLATLHLNRSREYVYLELFDEAIADASAVIALEPTNTVTLARAYVNRGQQLASRDRGGEAVADFSSALAVSSNRALQAATHVYRAEELARLGRLEEAIADASAAIDTLSTADSQQLDGTRATTTALLARAHLTRGSTQLFMSGEGDSLDDVADAIETDLTQAIDLLSGDDEYRLAMAHFSRGSLYYFTFDDAAALSDLERAKELAQPGDPLLEPIGTFMAEIVN